MKQATSVAKVASTATIVTKFAHKTGATAGIKTAQPKIVVDSAPKIGLDAGAKRNAAPRAGLATGAKAPQMTKAK